MVIMVQICGNINYHNRDDRGNLSAESEAELRSRDTSQRDRIKGFLRTVNYCSDDCASQ